MIRGFVALLLISTASVAVHAKDRTSGQRATSPWNVHYTDDKCQLQRSFSSGGEQTVLVFESGVTLDSGMIYILSPEKTAARKRRKISMQIGNVAVPTVGMAEIVPRNAKKDRIWRIFGVDLSPFNNATELENLTVSRNNKPIMHFEMEGVTKAVQALRQCQLDLLKQYGADLSKLSALKTVPKPIGNAGRWVTANDYPTGALSQNRQGEVVFQLMVDDTGKPGDCIILSSSGHRDLDLKVCALLKRRARFSPGVGLEGEPTSGPWFSRVNFEIPGRQSK